MCGIAGIVGPGAGADAVRRMTAAIAHRGPDGHGVLAEGGAAFGHTRLAVIDPESSAQPMTGGDGAWLTFNGEIYNYRELAPSLNDESPLKTRGDAEVLLRVLQRDGVKALDLLRGMFAFAYYERERGRLLLARDHLGQKPLYYWHEGDRFAFASEIKALLALEGSLAEIDPEALHEFLTLRIVSAPRSMFRRIRKLPAAHYLVFEQGRVQVHPYWVPRFAPKRIGSLSSAVEDIESALHDAVAHTLVSDVPVGAFLSGGLDSSLVAAFMKASTHEPFDAFTGDIAEGGRSELRYARTVAQRLGLRHHPLRMAPALGRSLPTVTRFLDEPADALAVCTFHLAELARQRVKVVLGGDGGDELFGGYDRYFAMHFVGRYALLPPAVRERVLQPAIRRLSGGHWYRSVGHRLKWLHHLASFEGGERYARSLGYFYFDDARRRALYTDTLRRRCAAFDPERAIAQLHDAGSAGVDDLDRMVRADCAGRLPDHPLMVLDRMTMAHGLEARSPLLDHRLFEACAQLPARFKVHGMRTRIIQKALARRHLPREVLRRSKQGFSSPLFYALRAEFPDLCAGLLRNSTLVEDGWLTKHGVSAIVDEHLGGRADHAQRLWLLCAAEAWHRIRIRGEQPDALEEALMRRAA